MTDCWYLALSHNTGTWHRLQCALQDLANLGSPYSSGSWDTGTLARAGPFQTLWIGQCSLVSSV